MVRSHDSIGVVHGIDDLRPAESSVDDVLVRKILRQRFPEANARAANKQDGAGGWRIGFVARLEGFDFRLERKLFCLGKRGCGDGEEKEEQGWTGQPRLATRSRMAAR